MGSSHIAFTPDGRAASSARSRPAPARAVAPRRRRGRVLAIFLTLTWIVPVATILVWGLEYYLTPIPERAHSDLHNLFKPSGTIGLGLGIVGTVLIVLGVGMYALRKRVRFLQRLGEMGLWLQLHIYVCTLGPVLILFHTAFKFGGIVSIGFWSMAVVALSGAFGRYLYAHIPRTIHGHCESLESLRVEQKEVIDTIRKDFGAAGEEIARVLTTAPRRHARGFLHALALMIHHALSNRRRLRKIKKILSRKNARAAQRREQPVYLRDTLIGLVREQVALERKILQLEPFQTIFKFWHIMHVPLTIVMFLIVASHIAVAILLGYTWIF